MLPKTLATGTCEIRIGQCVTYILHEKDKATGVEYKMDSAGKEDMLKAPIVIVSVQAIQSARLFLLSENSDSNRMVGRDLTYHTKGAVVARFKDKSPRDGGIYGPYQPSVAWKCETSTGLTTPAPT